MRFLGIFLLACCLTSSLPAQTADDLALRVQPEQVRGGVPQAFAFVFTNHSQRTMRIAPPTIDCVSTYNGSLWLWLRFTPSKPSSVNRSGRGCAADKWGWPPVLERIKGWNELKPGESMTIHADRVQLFYDDVEPGSYEFWAEYMPPSTSAAEQQILRDAGWSVPLKPVASQHVTFKKTVSIPHHVQQR